MEQEIMFLKSNGKKILACILTLFVGLFAMKALTGLKTPPKRHQPQESVLTVKTLEATPMKVQTYLSGFGEASPRVQVAIAPEVSGHIIKIHPKLKEGGVIEKGAPLFVLDTKELNLQETTAAKRLTALARNRDLLKKEYERTKSLYEKSKTGSLSDVEKNEQSYNTAKEAVDALALSLETLRLDIARSTVESPFKARVKSVSIETHQYIAKGSSAVTLADDTTLEVTIPLKGSEALSFLEFETEADSSPWFSPLKKKRCTISWNQGLATASGTMDRVVRYDATTRTLYVAVSVDAKEKNAFPIADGMFCKVTVPGKVLSGLFEVPSQAISSDGKVCLAQNNRLKKVSVTSAYTKNGYTYISSGISAGDQVITSRLVNPVEGARLRLTHDTQNGDQQ